MKKGISFQGYVALRLEPDPRSEMISQVLFGEKFAIKESHHDFMLISLDFDGSEGWVPRDSILVLDSPPGAINKTEPDCSLVTYPSITALDLKSGQQLILPAGSCWPSALDTNIKLEDRHFEVLSKDGLKLASSEADLEDAARRLMSLPYIRGGRCGFGFDAPGLVQMLCRLRGLRIPRTSILQAELGHTINFMLEVKAGDLAFFDNSDGVIDHVGLLLEGGRIVHAHHQVRIDRLDQQGIFCIDKDRYTHNLRIIKRISE